MQQSPTICKRLLQSIINDQRESHAFPHSLQRAHGSNVLWVSGETQDFASKVEVKHTNPNVKEAGLLAHESSRLHVVFALLLVELTFLLGSRILVLLVLRHEVVHVALSLGELHLPM